MTTTDPGSRVRRRSGPAPALLAALGMTAAAAGQARWIRIGDVDGFGIGTGAGLLNFEGDPVNVDGAGVLGPGDYLPDWNQDGLVQDFEGDDFELRAPAEIGGLSISTSGLQDVASFGSEFTDLSLSRSYDSTFGLPNDFPDPPSNDRNDAFFTFEFRIAVDAIDPGTPVYFNIVFGDIGAIAGELILTFEGGSMETQTIPPINPDVEDGLIAASFATLDFDAVFTEAGGFYEGYVEVLLVTRPATADGDPYYAIDYVELSTLPVDACPWDCQDEPDGSVNVPDFLALLAQWGQVGTACDFDGDGVSVTDFLKFLAEFGPCP